MRNWLYFFFGTPRRFVATASVFAVLGLIHYFAPGTLWAVSCGVIRELGPFLNTVLYFGLLFFLLFLGFRVMLNPFLKSRKK